MDFFDLIRSGKLEEIKLRVEADSSLISKKDDKGFPPLIMACYTSQNDVAKFLLETGADLNAQDAADNTALMGVSYKGILDIASILIEQGADVNIQNSQGYTALMFAAMFNQEEIIRLLIQHTADILITDSSGKTASDHAEFKGYSKLAELLKA